MAKKKKKSPKTENKVERNDDRYKIERLDHQFSEADRAIETVRTTWDEKERLFFGKPDKTMGNKSQVFDPRLSSIAIERSARVMAQNPTGKAMAISKDDKGKNFLMNLIIDKYVVPNANSQFDLLTKFRLLDLYSLIYGVSFGLVDWVVSDEYTGPDFWLLPIRSVRFQPGVVSPYEADWVLVDSWVTRDWIKERNKDTWNTEKLLDLTRDSAGQKKSEIDSKYRSVREEEFDTDTGTDKNNPSILLRTRYERDTWTTYAPDFPDAGVLREIDNPHENGELPVVAKYCFPLIDNIYGMGEFERGKSLQLAINSLINLYLDGVKMSLFPPVMIDPNGVVASSIKMGAGEKWLLTGSGEAPVPFQTSPQGINTFQSTYSFLVGSLLNQAGTTDTAVSESVDPGMGKTPQALKMQSQREGSRDSWDRFQMEQTLERIFYKFVCLIVKKQEKPITLRMFSEEIREIEEKYPDVLELIDRKMYGERGEISIKPGSYKGIKFDYEIVPSSTLKVSELEQNQALTQMLELVMKSPQLIQAAAQEGKTIKIGELFKQWVISSGVQDWDKIITEGEPDQEMGMPQEQPIPSDMMMEQQAMQQQMMQQPPQFQDPQIQQFAQQLLGGMGEIPYE